MWLLHAAWRAFWIHLQHSGLCFRKCRRNHAKSTSNSNRFAMEIYEFQGLDFLRFNFFYIVNVVLGGLNCMKGYERLLLTGAIIPPFKILWENSWGSMHEIADEIHPVAAFVQYISYYFMVPCTSWALHIQEHTWWIIRTRDVHFIY